MAVRRPAKYLAPYVKRGDENLNFQEMSVYDFIPDDHTKYTQDTILRAVATYLGTGNLTKASKASKVPISTIQTWKRDSGWWPMLAQYIRSKMSEELDAKLTGIINKAIDEMHDRMENGEEVVTKTGEIVKKSVSFRDLAVGAAIGYDKRALQRGGATQRVEHVDQRDRVKKLEQQFKRIANTKVIEGEVLSKERTKK